MNQSVVEMAVEMVNGIEVIHSAPAGMRDRALPTIFFFHGYTSSKEVYCYFGYALAQAGFRVIAPDAAMHGARYDGDEARRLRHFWDIFQSNVQELPALAAEYRRRGLIAQERIGVCGASLGGMTALASMARYPWISAAAVFMGSGYFSSLSRSLFPPVAPDSPDAEQILQPLADRLAEYDVAPRLAALADRPLLLWHGEADDLVPFQQSVRLREALTQRGLAGKLTWLSEPGIGHKITPSALQAGVTFFNRIWPDKGDVLSKG
ncbi:esterase [Affinibrenneria salicis]|uniref:Esterase n=1 Tax=Affinibrenneria salicis TaxID=2590031 RepID=A0A5J5FVS5_9GAMM|nr:esterase [Affinibrenneria salicis]KAA8997730.1 esterase [Affinibrenneria salicis]